jgi:hypothetical protein
MYFWPSATRGLFCKIAPWTPKKLFIRVFQRPYQKLLRGVRGAVFSKRAPLVNCRTSCWILNKIKRIMSNEKKEQKQCTGSG